MLIDHIDHFGGGYESTLRASFEQVCAELDLDLVIAVGRALGAPDPREQMYNAVYELLQERSVDGLILVTSGLATFCGPAGIQAVKAGFGPLPICSLGLEVPGVPSIVVDQRAGMRAVVEHLIQDHGRRRFAYIGGPEQNPDAALRLAVLQETLAEHGLSLDPARIVVGNFTYPSGIHAMRELLERGGLPDAVIAANDGMATGAIATLTARGLNVPSDVMVTGFDDLPLARLTEPALTTVGQPLARMARMAVRLIARQIGGESVERLVQVSAELVARASCSCDGPESRRLSTPVQAPTRTRPAELELKLRFEGIAACTEASLRDGHPEWVRVLLRGLLREVGGQAGAFEAALRECVKGIGRRRELYESLEQTVNLLWQEVRSLLPESAGLFNLARERVLRAHNRAQGQHILDEELTYMQILRSGERLSIVLDLPALRRALGDVIPAMGIRNAFVSLYTDQSRRLLTPFFCLHEGQLLPESSEPFDAGELLPPAARASAARRTLFALALASEARHWGVLVIEFCQNIGAHELLREQLSAALTTVALHREIIDKTKLHERSVQERLATAERMNALSVLAGGVAHDLNNALGPLVALPELIKKELIKSYPEVGARDPDALADLEHIHSSALRAAQVVKDLLTLGRQGKTELSALDLNQTLADCLSDARLRFPVTETGASPIVLHPASLPLPIRGASQQLGRAISNLIQNAVEASSHGAPVVLSAAFVRLDEPLHGYETVEPGEYAVVSVSDSGRGIAPAELLRIFEPFFSSKLLGERSGSGLGLAIVHGVVKEHHGFLNVQSRIGEGTTFTLYLPITQDTVPDSKKAEVVSGGSARILVVDDEALQLRAARRVLTHFGYETTTLSSGERALEIFERTAADPGPAEGPYDLVIMDVHLNQRLDGLAIIERVRAIYPRQKFLVVSGHAEATAASAVAETVYWLPKPYTADTLARAVQTALGSERVFERRSA